MSSNDAFTGAGSLRGWFGNVEGAGRSFGERVDRVGSLVTRRDPVAEAVVAALCGDGSGQGKRLLDLALEQGIGAVPNPPRALVRLFEQIDDVPFWVDREQLDLGGAAFLRCGVFGLFALGSGSLPLTYAPPAANKPLAFSKRL